MQNKKAVVILGGVSLIFFGFGCNPVRQAQEETAEQAIENSIEQETGENANVDVQNGQVRVETKDGSFYSGGQLPSDWPRDVPIMPGAQVQVSGSNNGEDGNTGSGVMFLTAKSADDVVSYYRDELTRNGWTFDGTASMNGFVSLTAKKGETSLSFVVQTAGEQTSVVIGIDR